MVWDVGVVVVGVAGVVVAVWAMYLLCCVFVFLCFFVIVVVFYFCFSCAVSFTMGFHAFTVGFWVLVIFRVRYVRNEFVYSRYYFAGEYVP